MNSKKTTSRQEYKELKLNNLKSLQKKWMTELKQENKPIEKTEALIPNQRSEVVFTNWCNLEQKNNRKLNSSDCRVCKKILNKPILIIP
jgi:hypothetical protein